MATLINAKSTHPDIKAAFPMHPCPAVEAGTPSLLGHLTVPRPIALATGTEDTVCIWGGVEDYYNRITAPKKLYFNLDFATHLEPCNPFPKRYNPWVRLPRLGLLAVHLPPMHSHQLGGQRHTRG